MLLLDLLYRLLENIPLDYGDVPLYGETENARHEIASKNQLGLRKKKFIRSTALYVGLFHIAEPFITTKTKCR